MAELRDLSARAAALRGELGISAPGEVIFESDLDVLSDKVVVVEADGFGGAKSSVEEGNFPIDYVSRYEKTFASEDEATEAAERVVEGRASPKVVLT